MFAPKSNSQSSKPNSSIFGSNEMGFIQAKLNVGKPGDKYEVEADSVADKVVSKNKNRSQLGGGSLFFSPTTPTIQKKEDTEIQEKSIAQSITPTVQLASSEEDVQKMDDKHVQAKEEEESLQAKEEEDVQKKEEETIQSKEDDDVQTKEDENVQTKLNVSKPKKANLSSRLQKAKGQGNAMSSSLKQNMEAGFGADFSGVKIHTDSEAVKMNKDLGAKAFTNKNDIFFNEGKFSPDSKDGQTLIAHELTHTIQQGASKPLIKGHEALVKAPENSNKPDTSLETGGNVTDLANGKVNGIEAKVKKEAITEEKTPKSPAKPEDDPAFQTQIKATERAREEKSQHPEASTKVVEQKAAGQASPESQANKNDQQVHAAAMSATSEKEREPFTPESFKKILEKNLDDLEKELPKNSEEAQDFKNEKPIKGIKENISGQVTSESDKLAGPMKNEADKPAPVSGQPTIEAQPLPIANAGTAPKPLNAKAAAPKPKTSQEISMEKESQSLDNKMSENNVTDKQLAKSNEPTFTGALEQKKQAQVEAKLAPVNYRKKEGAQLGVAQNNAATSSKEGLNQMQGAKQLSENTVLANQTTNKTNDKTEKEKIFAEFETIYEETKKTVTDSLEKLSEDVDKKFSQEAESAQTTFEKNVEDGLGDIYGWTVIDDWIFGEDTEAIDKLFRIEKNKFVAKMNSVLDDISVIIADGLNGALDAIEVGKKKSKEKFDSLDESQKKLGEDAFKDFNEQYTDLENTVYEKQDELASSLAKSYKENVDSLQAKFDEIKESVSAGWIGGALNALVGVIETIKKLKDLITTLLAEIQNAIGVIMEDPIGFVSTLFEGVGKGIDLFMANIKKHMLGGFVTWLTGAMGPVGITIPDNLFSLKGIFNLVMQVLGLSWDFMRKKSVLLLGEPMVQAMETSFEMFQTIKAKGISGIWEHIKEEFTDLKETIIESIKSMLITQVIEAGIKWMLSLLIPGAGFIKAIMAIKDLIVFFVESAIMLIPSLINAIKSLASGNIGGVAKAIEKGLAMLLPLVIGLFAKLIGLGGLVKKVQKIIKKVRKRIDRAINKLIKKAKKKFNKIFSKKKPKKGEAKKIKEDNKKQKPAKLTAKDKAEHLKIAKKIKKKLGEKAKKGEGFTVFHKRKQKEAKKLENKYQPQLKRGINLDISLTPLIKDKNDNDVDFSIKIAPNTTRDSGSADGSDAKFEIENKPKILNKLEKEVTNKDGSINKTLVNMFKKGGASNKYKLKGDKKEYQAYKVVIENEGGKVKSILIKRMKAEHGLPQLYISNKLLKEGKSKKYIAPHDNFIPKDLIIEETGTEYIVTYTTKRGHHKKGDAVEANPPKFIIKIRFDEILDKLNNVPVETREVIGENLNSKKNGVGRGKHNGAKAGSGFDNAHIIGDQFGGSGYNHGFNIHPASSNYNKKEMGDVEREMASKFVKSGKDYNLTAKAYLSDDTNSISPVKKILADEYKKDNKADKSTEVLAKKAQKRMVNSLQKRVTEDVIEHPAKFMRVEYESESLVGDFNLINREEKYNARDTEEKKYINNKFKEHTKEDINVKNDAGEEKISKRITIGEDVNYDNLVNTGEKNKTVEALEDK